MNVPARTILHVDMDAFYAAVEQLDHPEWRNKPVIVGAPPDRRGVVATCSYEARRFGVHSAMPSRTAGKLCPAGIFVPPRMERYEAVSSRIMDVFSEFTPLVEPLSLDEAFLDVTGAPSQWGDGVAIARELKRRVFERTGGLTASVGVAGNKFLAKVASDLHKPDGLTVVPRDAAGVRSFLAPLPVTRLWGVGKVSGQRLSEAGIRTIGQLQSLPLPALGKLFGAAGARHVAELCVGIDDRSVETEHEEKSVSGEHTFDPDCADMDQVRRMLQEQVERVGRRLRASGKEGGTAHLKVRFSDFRTITRQMSLARPTDSDRTLRDAAYALWEKEHIRQPVRLVGFGVSRLAVKGQTAGAGQQLLLDVVPPDKPDSRHAALDRTVDRLRETFGRDALKRGHWRRTEDTARQGQPSPASRVADVEAGFGDNDAAERQQRDEVGDGHQGVGDVGEGPHGGQGGDRTDHYRGHL